MFLKKNKIKIKIKSTNFCKQILLSNVSGLAGVGFEGMVVPLPFAGRAPCSLRALSMPGRFKAVQRHTVLTRAEPAGTHHRPTEAPVLSDKSLLVSSSLDVHHNEPD